MSIPDEAVEAAHKAWREQAAQPGSIFEYNLQAALEAAEPYLVLAEVDNIREGMAAWAGDKELGFLEGYRDAAEDQLKR